MNVLLTQYRHAEQTELDQQRVQIQQLLEEKARAEVRLEKLIREHTVAAAADVLSPLPPSPSLSSALDSIQVPAASQQPEPFVCLAMIEPPSMLGSSARGPAETTPRSTYGIHNRILIQQESSASFVSTEYTDSFPLGSRSITCSGSNSESEDIMVTLHDDYTACLRQLRTLQSKLETALNNMFVSAVGVPLVNFEQDAVARGKVVKVIEQTVHETFACLDQRILGPSAHRKIFAQGGFGVIRAKQHGQVAGNVLEPTPSSIGSPYRAPPIRHNNNQIMPETLDEEVLLRTKSASDGSGIVGRMKLNSISDANKFPTDTGRIMSFEHATLIKDNYMPESLLDQKPEKSRESAVTLRALSYANNMLCIVYTLSTSMPDQPCISPVPPLDCSYDRKRPSGAGADDDNPAYTANLLTVEDLLRRWTCLDFDGLDRAADLGK